MSSLSTFNTQTESQSDKPHLGNLSTGKTYFRVSASAFKANGDITIDAFSPWTRSEKGNRISTKTETTKLEQIDGLFTIASNTNSAKTFCLKTIRNKHRDLELKREINYIMDESSKIVSDVLFMYDVEEDLTSYVPLKKARVLPSVSERVKEVSDGRTTQEVSRIVNDLNIQKSQILSLTRGVTTRIKSGRGKKVPSDINKLNDRFAHASKWEDLQPVAMEKKNGDVTFRQIVGYPMALKNFSECLPTTRDFKDHSRWVDSLVETTKEDRKKVLDNLLATLPPSGSIGNIGSALMLDTTFSLSSGEYVTLAIGVTEMFTNKTSKKNGTTLLAAMIHSTKNIENHEEFSKYLNKQLSKYAIGKMVACICHDGESAFSAYNTGEVLKDAILLRCDVHRLENFKNSFSKEDAHLKDEMVYKLFGRKIETEYGTVLKKGALNVMTIEEYEKKFNRLYQKCPSGPQAWLNKNKTELFETNSLRRKLLAGQTQQFFSTNIVEGRNAMLKLLMPKAIPAHEVLEKLFRLHEEEIKDRILAIRGLSDKLVSLCTIDELDWQQKNNYERTIALKGYGLEEYYYDSALIKYPIWLGEPTTGTRDVFMRMVQQQKVHPSGIDTSTYFTMDSNKETACVQEKCDVLRCIHKECRREKSGRYHLCKHALAVFLYIADEGKKQRVVEGLRERRLRRTMRDKQAAQLKPSDGGKTRRRGKKRFLCGVYKFRRKHQFRRERRFRRKRPLFL